MTTPRPRVGLTVYRERAAWGVWDESADLLPAGYSDAVAAAGGLPLLLPAPADGADERAAEAVAALDGLLLAGGPDLDPATYGAERDASTGPPRPQRDAWELALARAADRADLPVLAICRGMQVFAVALGGTLVQHLPDAVGSTRHSPTVGVHGRHEVTVDPASRLGAALGPSATVATYHHQAVDRLPERLSATAWAEDGVLEAAESRGRWAVCVQWHPEVHDGSALFGAFVGACRADRV